MKIFLLTLSILFLNNSNALAQEGGLDQSFLFDEEDVNLVEFEVQGLDENTFVADAELKAKYGIYKYVDYVAKSNGTEDEKTPQTLLIFVSL